MPKLNVKQNNSNVIKVFQVALETGHRNLLDNPFFTVNQRNFTTSTGVNNIYSVDRWYIARGTGTISKTSNGITINGVGASRETTFQQMIDCGDLTGRTVALSVNDGGTIRQITGIVPARTTSNNIFIRFTLRAGVSAFLYAMVTSSAYAYMLQFQVNAGYTIDIRAVKLELGSYSTLANDVPPDYAKELAKCRYYFRRISNTSGYTQLWLLGRNRSTTGADFHGALGNQPMRTAPTISRSGSIYVQNSDTNIAITDLTRYFTVSSDLVFRATVASGLTANAPSALAIGPGAYIDLSADL